MSSGDQAGDVSRRHSVGNHDQTNVHFLHSVFILMGERCLDDAEDLCN